MTRKDKWQEWFNVMVKGLRAQGGRSEVGGNCVYRDGRGRKCAIGHLIPDDVYDRGIEGSTVSCVKVWGCIPGAELEDLFFLKKAQNCLHDVPTQTACWEVGFAEGVLWVARFCGLAIPA